MKNETVTNELPVASSQQYIMLKSGNASKLGKRAEGSIKYEVLASENRKHLYLRITGNESGGYYSKEIVPFDLIEQIVADCEPDKPFPSKALKDTFKGRSSNNAGFLAAILRVEDLLAAAPDTETQHVRHSDMAAWKSKLLTEPGRLITLTSMTNSVPVAPSGPDGTDNKTLSLPRKKA